MSLSLRIHIRVLCTESILQNFLVRGEDKRSWKAFAKNNSRKYRDGMEREILYSAYIYSLHPTFRPSDLDDLYGDIMNKHKESKNSIVGFQARNI